MCSWLAGKTLRYGKRLRDKQMLPLRVPLLDLNHIEPGVPAIIVNLDNEAYYLVIGLRNGHPERRYQLKVSRHHTLTLL